MEFFVQFKNVYEVNPTDGCLDFRDADLSLVDPRTTVDQLRQFPFMAHGIMRQDLAVFAQGIDETGCTGLGFLVTETNEYQGRLVTPELMEHDLDHATPELAYKITDLKPEELAQLGIDSLAALIKKKYPHITAKNVI